MYALRQSSHLPAMAMLLSGTVVLCLISWKTQSAEENAKLVAGQVVNSTGPATNAVVRVQGEQRATTTDSRGRFSLSVTRSEPLRITAAKPGYYIAGEDWQGSGQVLISLKQHPATDCPTYQWIDPRPDPNKKQQCGNCHVEIFNEWSISSHAHSATNKRLLNIYEGTDWHGNENVGWNLLQENVDGAGVCYSCHVPSPEPDVLLTTNLHEIGGVHKQGIHCDFCHKIADVSIDRVGWNHGRFAMKMLRPADDKQVIFGPLDDAERGENVHSPLYRESRYCASCHEGVLFGTHAYGTYSEWLASPAAKQGKSCQDCHMAPTGHMRNMAPNAGGIDRNPLTLANHSFPGSDPDFVSAHMTLTLDAKKSASGLDVIVNLRTHDVGHRVPTGHPQRALILWIRAVDQTGKSLDLVDGPVLPDLAGSGSVDEGALAGQPGRYYAKVLETLDGDQPAPFWRVTRLAYDSRLQPDQTNHTHWTFKQGLGRVTVRAKLIYRRFSKAIADEKRWPDNEFLVTESKQTIR